MITLFKNQLKEWIKSNQVDKILYCCSQQIRKVKSVFGKAIFDEIFKIRSFYLTTQTKTAHIDIAKNVAINPDFIEKYVEHPKDLLFVLLHEIAHYFRGDLYRNILKSVPEPQRHSIANFTFDLLINSSLIKDVFEGETIPFVKRFYSQAAKDEFFFNLMFPPGNKIEIPKNKTKEAVETFEQIYKSVWSSSGISSDVIAEKFYRVIENYEIVNIWFLGKHERGENGGWGDSEIVEEEKVPVGKVSKNEWEVYEAVRKVLAPSSDNLVTRELLIPEISVIPFFGRREYLCLSSGVWPVFFKYTQNSKDLTEWQAMVYLDVSGTFYKYIGFIIGLLKHNIEYIGRIFQFSNKVFEVDKSAVFRGKIKTTWGTDFNCVGEHALQNKFKRILVITDGDAYFYKPEIRERLKKEMEVLAVLLVGKFSTDIYIKDVAKYIFRFKREP